MLDELAEVVATIKRKKDARFFLERLLTESEIVMLTRRLQTAQLLAGGLTYDQIQRELGVGVSTIQATVRWLTDAVHEYRDLRSQEQEKIKERIRMQQHQELKKQPHRESTMPGTLAHTVQHDSRFVILNLLLG